jgi:hypothetical protein
MDETKKKPDQKQPDEANSRASVTRRELLCTLGSAVILSGIRVLPLQAGQQPAARATLPPGLYQPSFDHLNHALTNESPFVPIPPGAETEYLRPRSGPFVPQAFAPSEFHLIRRLVEIILGEDLRNTVEKLSVPPGSIYDEVAEWIDLVVASAPRVRILARNLPADQRALAVACLGSEPVSELETFEPERACREGFVWLAEEAQRRFAKSFLDAGPARQLEVVVAISDSRPDKSVRHAGSALFDFLKTESVRGFYTSRMGLKELNYQGNAFYGNSPGCGIAPLSQQGAPPAGSKEF